MGALTVFGVSAGEASKISAQWMLKAGEPYDVSYVTRFKAPGEVVGGKNVEVQEKVNRENGTVDVVLTVKPR